MLEVVKYIIQQVRNHANYANSFKRANSLSNEQIHPKTGKTISNIEALSLIERDAEKKAKAIQKKFQSSSEMQNFIGMYKSFGVELLVDKNGTNFEVSLPLTAKKMAGVDLVTVFDSDGSFKEIIFKSFL
jgi:hypothetical protein